MPQKSKHAIPDEKKALLLNLIKTYDVKTTADLQEALKGPAGGDDQTMLEQEIDTQIEEQEALDPSYSDSRNGYKDKTLRSSYGEIPIQVPLVYYISADKQARIVLIHAFNEITRSYYS